MNLIRLRVLAVLATLGLAGVVVAAQPAGADEAQAKHVLLISVDGLHQTDLAWYVRMHPDSALARLVHEGVNFTNAQTPFPSDSFPGMVGQVTGGDPKTTGVYYDDSYNRTLLPAGTTTCAGATRNSSSHGSANTSRRSSNSTVSRRTASATRSHRSSRRSRHTWTTPAIGSNSHTKHSTVRSVARACRRLGRYACH